ncbi:hypothetical protein GOBAR_AA06229 [Gossypium barbadense]|uniref:Uncharacterized protein n=1 Tax=Gossypium barbadense TaxID=3634 RepID=A0A2P5YFK8_GOSBA|nr:hypothetical protein GOBAR_AA06229 [Gossypium barbadense]
MVEEEKGKKGSSVLNTTKHLWASAVAVMTFFKFSITGKRNQTSPVGSPLAGNISDNSSKEQDRFLPVANANPIMKKKNPSPSTQKYPKKPKRQCKNVHRSSSVLSLARPPISV